MLVTATQPSYALLYDGSCSFCRKTVELIRWWGPCCPLRLVDATDPRQLAAYPQISLPQAMQNVHLIFPDGSFTQGYDAFVALTAILPWFHWLTPLLRLKPIRWLGWKVYNWIKTHRHHLSTLLRLS